MNRFMKLFCPAFLVGLTQLTPFAYSLENVLFPFEITDSGPEVLDLLSRAESVSKKVPGWFLRTKMEGIIALILNAKPKVCVEVGTFGGTSLIPMILTLEHLHCGHVYAIDSWSNRDCVKYMSDDDPNKSWWSQVPLNEIYEQFKCVLRTERLERFCTLYNEDSVSAASHIEDNSVELLHWDGNHSFLGAQRDFQAYLPKVKAGGYILVSDVMWNVSGRYPIDEAADELFNSCELVDLLDGGNVLLFRKFLDGK